MLAAGAEGVAGDELPEAAQMPASLGAALDIAESSEFIKRSLPAEFLRRTSPVNADLRM